MTVSTHERTILVAAAAILRDDGIERVRAAETLEERFCANAALRASVDIEGYLDRVDALERPF